MSAGFAFACWVGFAGAQDLPFTTDFEEGDLAGWKWTEADVAFRNQPTQGDNPKAGERGESSNHEGDYWIGTFERYRGGESEIACTIQGDEPTGRLKSADFTIPGGTLTFLVGGGASFDTRVELIVPECAGDGGSWENRVYFASGRNSETMRRVTWDLDPWRCRKGFIRIVDDSSGPWGHINVDDFQFLSPESTSAAPDCPDGSCRAEGSCCDGQALCPDGRCPLDGSCCDGQALCPDGRCPLDGSCCDGQALCPDGRCPLDGSCCDGQALCPDGRCPLEGYCCDGQALCPDGSMPLGGFLLRRASPLPGR